MGERPKMALNAHTTATNSGEDAAEDLIYHITHDLRAPVRAIRTLPDWVEEDLASNDVSIPTVVTEHLDIIRQQAKTLDQMILDLRNFSRVGRMTDAPSVVDLEAVIRQIVTKLPETPLLRLHLDLDIPHVIAPLNDLTMMLDALLTNALQHHDKDEAHVTVSSAFVGDRLLLEISDDGPGVELQNRERAFALMTTLYRRDDGAGTGIGLALARRVVANLNGTITLEDTPNDRGIAVRIVLPPGAIARGG